MWELAVGQFVSLNNPGMFEDLLGSQPLMRVHVKHLGHKVLKRAHIKYETDIMTEKVIAEDHEFRSCRSDLQLYLGSVGHGVPVSSSQTEAAVAYPVQDLIWGVLGSVGKRSKTGGRHR